MDNCYLEGGLLSVVHTGDNLLSQREHKYDSLFERNTNVIIQGNIALFVEAIEPK